MSVMTRIACCGRIDIGSARDVFLQHVVLHRARKLADVGALTARHRHIQSQQDRRRRIDGHRGRNFRQIDAVEEPLHIFDRINRDANLPDFACRERVIGIHTDLRRQIERNRQSRSAVGQQIFVALVRFLGVAHAGVLAHGPQAAAVHGGLHAAGEWIFPGIADFALVVGAFEIGRSVERLYRDVRGGFNLGGTRGGSTQLLGHRVHRNDTDAHARYWRWLFLRTLQNELRPNQANVTAKSIATPARPGPTCPA